MNVPLISRDIELCAQKVEPRINRESLAVLLEVVGRLARSRYLSDALTGRTMSKKNLVLYSVLEQWDLSPLSVGAPSTADPMIR